MRLIENVTVELNSSDITSWIIEYTRTQQICSGVGTLQLIVPTSSGLDFDPWDIIEIYEYGDKVGKFYVSESKESPKGGILVVGADDGSKLITDYFLTETYQSDILTYSRYWIQRILDEATVNYQFTVGDDQGGPVNPNTSFGLDSAYNLIQGLLQQSGWYLYFNPDGIAIIGRIDKNLSDPDHIISDSDILTLERERDDARLRNRAVVWGNANPLIGEQVFVDITLPSPWQIDSKDERTVVLANSSIYSNAVGVDLARKLLHEFEDIKDEKVILTACDKNFKIGDVIRVNSNYWTGSGLLTTLEASMSENGLVHTLTINEKCPRLFAYFGLPLIPVSGFYVYVGTEANGVWKKYTEGSTWYDTSSGLDTDLNIIDLFIKDDIHACVTSNGFLYTKTSDAAPWSKYDHPDLRDRDGVSYIASGILAKACSINDIGNIVAGYDTVTLSGEIQPIPIGRSWVLEVSPNHNLVKAEQVAVSGIFGYITNLGITDIESTGEYNIVSVSGVAQSGYVMEAITWYRRYGLGHRDIQAWNASYADYGDVPHAHHGALPADSNQITMGAGRGYIPTIMISALGSEYMSQPVVDSENLDYWVVSRNAIFKLSPSTVTSTAWGFTPIPVDWPLNDYPYDDGHPPAIFLHRKDSNTFNIILIFSIQTEEPVSVPYPGHYMQAYRLLHYDWDIGDSTPTKRNEVDIMEYDAFNDSINFYGAGLIDDEIIMCYRFGAERIVTTYDITTHFTNDVVWHTDGEHAQDNNPDWENSYGVEMVSTGDEILFFTILKAGSDKKYWPPVIIGDIGTWATQKISIYYQYVSLDRYGILDTGYVKLTEKNETDNNYWNFSFSTPPTVGYCVDTLLDDAYYAIRWGISSTTRVFYPGDGGKSYYYQMILKIPGGNKIDFRELGPYTSANPPPYLKSENGDSMWDFDVGGVSFVAYGTISKFYGPYFVAAKYYGFGDNFYTVRSHTWNQVSSTINTEDSMYSPTNDPTNGDDLLNGMVSASSLDASNNIITTAHNDLTSIIALTDTDGHSLFSTFGLTQGFGYSSSSSSFRLYIPGEWIYNSLGNGGDILKHTTISVPIGGITASDLSEIQSWGNFELILETPAPAKVEISKGSPTLVYTIPSGIPPNWEDSFFAATTSNGYGTFYSHVNKFPTFDARVVDLLDPAAFPVASGVFDPDDFQRFNTFATPNGWAFSNYQFSSNWTYIASGLITFIESSNYTPYNPYLFYSTSGVVTKRFMQKNPISSVWQDFTTTLPDSEITIIRCDDQF